MTRLSALGSQKGKKFLLLSQADSEKISGTSSMPETGTPRRSCIPLHKRHLIRPLCPQCEPCASETETPVYIEQYMKVTTMCTLRHHMTAFSGTFPRIHGKEIKLGEKNCMIINGLTLLARIHPTKPTLIGNVTCLHPCGHVEEYNIDDTI